MTNYEDIQSKNIHELALWLAENGQYDNSPWAIWFSNKYCKNCEPIMVKPVDPYFCFENKEIECAPCEMKDPKTGEYNNPCDFANCEVYEIIEAWLKENTDESSEIIKKITI